jgi:uncharacterized phage infection (PIP) family protein YhgE
MTSPSNSLANSLGSPTTPFAANVESDRQDLQTLRDTFNHIDRSNIPRELTAAVSTFFSRTMEGLKLLPKPKVGQTSQYHPNINDADSRVAQFVTDYNKARNFTTTLLNTNRSLRSEIDDLNTIRNDKNEDRDSDTIRAKTKECRELAKKQTTQLETLRSKLQDHRYKPECINDILATPDTQEHHLQIATLCKIIQSHSFALGGTIDREFKLAWPDDCKAGTESCADLSVLDRTKDSDDGNSTEI